MLRRHGRRCRHGGLYLAQRACAIRSVNRQPERCLGICDGGVGRHAGRYRQGAHASVAAYQGNGDAPALGLARKQAEIDPARADAGTRWEDNHDATIACRSQPGDGIGDLVVDLEIANTHATR
jgi:hypothetical protein